MNEIETLSIPSWDELFLRKMYLASSKSKDRRTKVGAVLVKDKADFASGYNGISPGVREDIEERHISPTKYLYYEHAERNAIYFCAQQGFSTKGSTLYTNGIPCCNCSRGVIRAGIVEIVVHKQWVGNESSVWTDDLRRAEEILKEAGIKIRTIDLFLNIKTMQNGKIITV